VEKCLYPDPTRDALRGYLTNVGYPLWALCHANSSKLQPPDLAPWERVIDKSPLSNEDIAAILPHLRRSSARVEDLVRERRFAPGMGRFLDASAPELLSVAADLHLPVAGLIQQLSQMMNAECWLWREQEILERLPGLQADLEMVLALNGILGKTDTSFSDALSHLRGWLQDAKLPLFVFREQEDEDLSNLLDALDILLQNPHSCPERRSFAARLFENRDAVRGALSDRFSPLARWTENHLQVSISLDEAVQILEELPSRATISADLFRAQISRQLDTMSKQKLVGELLTVWEDLTSSATPDMWSEERGVPIHWVLDGADYAELWALMRNPQSGSEEQLCWATEFLGTHSAELRDASDKSYALQALGRIALGAYRALAETTEDLDDLSLYVNSQAGPLGSWQREQVERLGRTWVQRTYRQKMYQRALARVDETPEAQLRKLIKELIEDPLVGAKLLQSGG